MKVLFKKLLLFILIIIIFLTNSFSDNETYFSPDNALRNPNKLNIPPLKIEGFVLGMLKINFVERYKKYFKKAKKTILILRKKSPRISVYKFKTYKIENFVFYIYDNILAKIYIIVQSPFHSMQSYVNRFVNQYGRPYNIRFHHARRYRMFGYHWKTYIWKRYYKYTPEFSRQRYSFLINISLDFSLHRRKLRRLIYRYSFDDTYLSKHFGKPLYDIQ